MAKSSRRGRKPGTKPSNKADSKPGKSRRTKSPARKSRGAQKKEQDNGQLATITIPDVLPVLTSRDLVAFPTVMVSLDIVRESSIAAVQAAFEGDRLVMMLAQRNPDVEEITPKDVYRVGIVAHIARTLKLPDGRLKVLLQGWTRAKVVSFDQDGQTMLAKVAPLPPPDEIELSAEDEVIINRIRENLQVLVQYEHLPEEMLLVIEELEDPGVLADHVFAHYKLPTETAQQALEQLDPLKRLRLTDTVITDDLNQFLLSEKIRVQARDEMSKGQREYYLREQIKQIQRELGEGEGASEDLAALKLNLDQSGLTPVASEEAMKQFRRLERMNAESSEYAMLRTYLEWICDLPWSVTTGDKPDLKRATQILDRDHFGLEKCKDRILEYLSVRRLKPDSKGPILCFVGPPGVGKTSLGQSIAKALNRKFVRMSLGGIRDEAEIRGHRRTYVGALPGRILQGLKQAESRDPVFLLDELDKIGADFRGDPASALLEVLDPAQNKDFRDLYLGIPFDLSETIFIATANTVDTIPDALLDRLEVIYLSGYTTQEKEQIARKYLIPRQLEENGLSKLKINVDDPALLFLIERYTREAGVRSLEREIGSLCRKVAREYTETKRVPRKLYIDSVQKLLGPTKFDPDPTDLVNAVGVSQGLAWTAHGGEVMPVEVSIASGSGVLNLTGQLGNVMQESAQAAVFYARSNAKVLGLDVDFHQKLDIHLHVPSGATPKDGPSAGITIVTALVSALSGRKVHRDIAMTGEITLRGNILAVGGIKEKALAALRQGITRVILPFENIKDLEEIPREQRRKLKFVPVKHINEVLEIVLEGPRIAGKKTRRVRSAVRAHV